MTNEKKRKQYPKATIQLDKLVFCCKSTVEDNFNYAVECNPNYYFEPEFQFNQTKLIRFQDPAKRFKHSFKVLYKDKQIGSIDFNMYGALFDNLIRFTVLNEVFYNNTLKCVPVALKDLNLEINNFNKIDVSIDCYNYDIEHVLRKNIRAKDNTVKLFGQMIKDRDKVIREITYYNHGSRNNPYLIRSILIKNKKGTFELSCYNKTEEIKQSKKEYINDYHKEQNSKFSKLFRIEVRLTYDEIHRYIKKHKKPISFDDIMNAQFLHEMFSEYLDRIIVIYKNGTNKRKRDKVSLIPTIDIVPSEGILQPTLPDTILLPQHSENETNNIKNFDNIKNSIINQYKEVKYKHEIFINKINNNINKYLNYNNP
ncbi:hypothetical protein [Dysgonomonas sp. 511]|uniref:hypothetical protein n=1 Tax=Dysgonomonas sp. 511 TaxID=2302930 RepID=UPI0013D56C88|nr:hypothetical protein [Dysgonomonas sp. 511]NDV78613.1 hypothetical protein [Dysgonomonas sp. 511]